MTAEPAEEVLAALEQRSVTLAVAESITGGMLGELLTSVPGASKTFRGGVIAYATDVKASVLGVDRDLLAAEGAVHPEVARQLATGARDLFAATYGLGITGVAGPDPQDGKPPGTVFVAVAGPEGVRVEARPIQLPDPSELPGVPAEESADPEILRKVYRVLAAKSAFDLLLDTVR